MSIHHYSSGQIGSADSSMNIAWSRDVDEVLAPTRLLYDEIDFVLGRSSPWAIHLGPYEVTAHGDADRAHARTV
jgi:hypothetical protein